MFEMINSLYRIGRVLSGRKLSGFFERTSSFENFFSFASFLWKRLRTYSSSWPICSIFNTAVDDLLMMALRLRVWVYGGEESLLLWSRDEFKFYIFVKSSKFTHQRILTEASSTIQLEAWMAHIWRHVAALHRQPHDSHTTDAPPKTAVNHLKRFQNSTPSRGEVH